MNFSKYIGIPYKNLGRDFDGCDCFGLFHLIYSTERGIILPDYTDLKYDKEWYKNGCSNHILDNINSAWEEVQSNYTTYDALIFFLNSKLANHIGMYIGDNKFIHLYENSTSGINRLDKLWTAKLYKAVRYCG